SVRGYCKRCKRRRACRTARSGWCRFRRARGRSVCLQKAKTRCEKKDRGWGILLFPRPGSREEKAESFCSSAPAVESSMHPGAGFRPSRLLRDSARPRLAKRLSGGGRYESSPRGLGELIAGLAQEPGSSSGATTSIGIGTGIGDVRRRACSEKDAHSEVELVGDAAITIDGKAAQTSEFSREYQVGPPTIHVVRERAAVATQDGDEVVGLGGEAADSGG